jgi:predicted dehydrogenase
MSNQVDRRHFLQGSIAAVGTTLAGVTQWGRAESPLAQPADIELQPLETVRIGFVGIGSRGTQVLRNLLRVEGCRVEAVCDIIPERVERAQQLVTAKGDPRPKGFDRGPVDYQRLCQEDLHLVVTATPWELHVPVSVAALEAGKHAAPEVPAAMTVEQCWQLVEASEKAQRHCAMMENYCYFREMMCILNMVRHGILGDPMHVYAGYQKDALFYSFNSDGTPTFAGEAMGRAMGNSYPTHHVAPPAQWMGINRGDAFDYLVSMGNYAATYNQFAAEIFGKDHPMATEKFDMSDISNTMIRTKKGRSIVLILDDKSPRPHRHYFRLQATKGFYEHISKSIHVHGRTGGYNPSGHAWRELEPLANYYDEFEHPLWREFGETTKTSGHGGSDYLTVYSLVNALRTGTYPDIDVYDTAAWSCIVGLSEDSARNRSKAVDFPDFTRGAWKTRKPMPIRRV